MDRKETILVVDDDKEIVELMQDFLEDEGYRVEKAFDAGQALKLLNQVPVDCILLDVMMPGQDGFELCREIRRNNDVPIFF